MKKVLLFCLCLLMTFSIIACDESSQSSFLNEESNLSSQIIADEIDLSTSSMKIMNLILRQKILPVKPK